MKRLILAATLVLAAFASPAQNIDDIVNKHIDAIGGRDNWNKLSSMKMECGMKIQGSDIKITICAVDKVAVRQDIEAMGMKGFSIVTTKEGWNFMPFQGHTKPERMTEEDLKNAQDDLNIKDEFITYKDLGKKIEYLGKDEVEGMDCHKIKMVDKNGVETTYYMDTESFYVIKQVDKMTSNGKEFENTTIFSNFEKLKEGIVYPMAISANWGVTEISNLEFNTKLDESIFKLPEPQK
jgi:hypothetical protein